MVVLGLNIISVSFASYLFKSQFKVPGLEAATSW